MNTNNDDKTGKDNESNGSSSSNLLGNGFMVFGTIVVVCAFPLLLLVPVVMAMVGASGKSSGESSDCDYGDEGGYPW